MVGTGSRPASGWLDEARQRLAYAAGEASSVYDLSPAQAEALLNLAGAAAHESGDRKNAPLVAYLVGLAKGRNSSRSFDELVRSIRDPGTA
ncbi:MAG: DUF6457 domain-containing protein [Acidimicrobiales bacterium]